MFRKLLNTIRNLSLKSKNFFAGWSASRLAAERQMLLHHLGKKRPSFRQLLRLPLILKVRERITLAALIIIVVSSGFIAFSRAWQWFFVRVPAHGGVYTEGIVGAPRLVNPLYASSNPADRDLAELLFSGLIRFNEKGEIEPDLAERIELSEDAREYTIVLKEDLQWSDGEPVTSEDIRFTVEAVKNPLYQSPLRSQFANVTVEASDEKTARIKLSEPSAPFIENLAIGLIPSHLWSAIDPRNAALADLNIKPVSVGPFRFDTLSKDASGAIRSYTVVSRNDGIPRKPYLDSITFKFYASIPEALTALAQKNIDGMGGLPPERMAETKTRKDIGQYSLPLPQYVALFYRQGGHPALGQVEVRRALGMAVNRETIVAEALLGVGHTVESPFAAGAAVFPILASTTPYDPALAGRLLDEGGWKLPDTQNGLRKNSKGEELVLTLTTLSQEDLFHTAEIIQKNWQAIGVRTSIQVVDNARVAADVIRPREYQIMLVGEITGIDPDPYAFWHSSQAGSRGLNLSDYSNREVDKLLEEARKTNDRALRERNYQAMEIILQREQPATFLYTLPGIYLVAKKVQGILIPALSSPSDRFAYIERWYETTRWGLKPLNR